MNHSFKVHIVLKFVCLFYKKKQHYVTTIVEDARVSIGLMYIDVAYLYQNLEISVTDQLGVKTISHFKP